MSRQGLDATSKVDGYELNSERGRRKATIPRTRRVLAMLAASAVTAVVFLMAVDVAASVAGPPAGNWTQTLNEEFSANGVNTALWTPEWPSGAMSGECTSPSLVSQPGNGYLSLELQAKESTCGGTKHPDTGSLIESNPADGKPGHSGFAYTYGYVEWRAYLVGVSPKGRGCPTGGCLPDWPALWSLSSTNANEIDTMEGLETLGQACYHIHPPPGKEGPGHCLSGSYNGWHTYASEWEPGVVKFFYDGAQVGELSSEQLNGTPQYLIADMVAPGCCGQPSAFPDEMKLDYVKVWQKLPIVTTGAATGKQPLQATLNGTVNSNGLSLSNCYFEYGTSPSYGSSAPCTGSESSESATVSSLTPGTTYHFRIVATNGSGPAYGNDETFTTPCEAPIVTTIKATEIQETQAMLAGEVNPSRCLTQYRFEYRAAETETYTSTAWKNAGAGNTAVHETETVKALQPGTSYYYRIVAKSAGGEPNGGLENFVTAPPRSVFFADAESSGALSSWLNGPVGWEALPFGGDQVAAGSSPVSVWNPTSKSSEVFFVDASHGDVIADWVRASGKEGTEVFGGDKVVANTSPAVVWNPTLNVPEVYFVDATRGNTITDWSIYAGGKGWEEVSLGGDAVASGSSPAVVWNPTATNPEVLFVDAAHSDSLADLERGSTGKWGTVVFSSDAVAANTSPAVVWNTTSASPEVFMVDSVDSDSITDWLVVPGKGWEQEKFYGDAVASGSSPAAVWNPTSKTPEVFIVDSAQGNSIEDWLVVPGKGWEQEKFYGDAVASGSSPAVVWNPTSASPEVFMVDAANGDTITDWLVVPGVGWHRHPFYADVVDAKSSPSVAWNTTKNIAEVQFADATTGGTVTEWAQGSKGWGWSELPFGGDQVAAGSSPVSVWNPTSKSSEVFFVDASHGDVIADWVRASGKEGTEVFGGDKVVANTSPAVVWNPTLNVPEVYFVDATRGNTITDWSIYAGGKGWEEVSLGGDAVASGSSPAVVWNPTATNPEVLFVDAAHSDSLADLERGSTGKWGTVVFSSDAVAANTSPAVVWNTTSASPEVFMVDSVDSDSITDWLVVPGKGWEQEKFYGDAVASGSSPAAVWNPTSKTPEVFIVDSAQGNSIEDWLVVPGKGWEQEKFYGDAVASGSSPAAVWNPTSKAPEVFMVDAADNNTITDWGIFEPSKGWEQHKLWGSKVAAKSSPNVD